MCSRELDKSLAMACGGDNLPSNMHFNTLASLSTPTLQVKIVDVLMSNEAIQFCWCTATNVVNIEVHDQLLKMVIGLFITIQEFSYSRLWIEHYH